MSPEPIRRSAIDLDMSPRFTGTSTVVGSPALAAETIIASITLATFGDMVLTSGVRLSCFAAFTVGTSGVSATMRVRQTDVNGTVVQSTGALTVAAGNLYAPTMVCFDAQPGKATYVLTLQIGSGAATSTVSAVHMSATWV